MKNLLSLSLSSNEDLEAVGGVVTSLSPVVKEGHMQALNPRYPVPEPSVLISTPN